MKIMVSACLLGINCKYNGKNNYNQKVMDIISNHELIPVCPEVLGGLSTPRIPSEIVNGIVINKEGINVDYEFRKGAKLALKQALDQKVDCVIVQSRSPSCGKDKIYDGTFSKKLISGDGIFVQLVNYSATSYRASCFNHYCLANTIQYC